MKYFLVRFQLYIKTVNKAEKKFHAVITKRAMLAVKVTTLQKKLQI